MSEDLVQKFRELIKARSDAYRAVEQFALSNFPFTDEQKAEFLDLEEKASAASKAFAELSLVKSV